MEVKEAIEILERMLEGASPEGRLIIWVDDKGDGFSIREAVARVVKWYDQEVDAEQEMIEAHLRSSPR